MASFIVDSCRDQLETWDGSKNDRLGSMHTSDLVWRSHTLSVKRGEGLVCLASTSCAEGMQFKCNTSGEARAAHAISASATANKRNRVCVYVQYTKLQPLLVPPEFGSQGNTYSLTGLTNSIVLSESRGRSATAILLT